jgi:ketosteroid isomerase-like protein
VQQGDTIVNQPLDLPIEAQISNLERQWADAFQRKDLAALQNMMAVGYSLVIAIEDLPLQVIPRDAWLEELGDYNITEASVDHIHVRIYDCVAVAVMLWRQKATLHGEDRTAVFMLTDIWVHVKDGWRLAERHSSRPEHPGGARPHTLTLECDVC